MEVFAIIDGINARKAAMNMTNQQIADASNIPKSTVDRILRKDTENPTMKVILDIANAVGYDFSTPSTMQKTGVAHDDPYVQHIIALYETRVAEQSRHYNLVTAEKNRWIKLLTATVFLLVFGILFILIYDITHPDVGWFQRDSLYSYTKSAENFLLMFRNWLGI